MVSARCKRQQEEEGKVNRFQQLSLLHAASRSEGERERESEDSAIEAERARRAEREGSREGGREGGKERKRSGGS